MPKKKHSRGDLSRRAFIKTATAATAAASVGIRPGSTHTEPEESAAASSFRTPWEINHKQIQTLWFNIWPKITALAWLNPVKQVSDASFSSTSISYRRAFAGNAAFRVAEAERIASLFGFTYTSTIPICITDPSNMGMKVANVVEMFERERFVDLLERAHSGDTPIVEYLQRIARDLGVEELLDLFERGVVRGKDDQSEEWVQSCPAALYGEKYFLINDEGFVMPWLMESEAPTEDQMFIGYSQGGGVLPRRKAFSSTGPSDYNLDERTRFTELTTQWTPQFPLTNLDCKITGLSGVALLSLFDKWSKVVALAWQNQWHMTEVQDPTKIRDYIMPEVWTQWPDYLKATIKKDSDDIKLIHSVPLVTEDAPPPDPNLTMELQMPIASKPINADNIFRELLLGYASNPMYTNTFS